MKFLVASLILLAAGPCLVPVGEGDPDGGDVSGAGGGNPLQGGLCHAVTVIDPGDSVQPPGACLCTRRDLVPVGMCPRGVGQSASAMIDSTGGTVTLTGQQPGTFRIAFPPTALSKPTLITVTETTLPPPAGMVDWSPVYVVEPVGLVLAEPAQVVVPNGQGRGFALGNPTVFWSGSSPCELERLPSSYANAGFNNGNVGRLGYAISGYASAGDAGMCQ